MSVSVASRPHGSVDRSEVVIRGTVNTIPSHDAVLRRVVDDLTRTREPTSPEDLAQLLRPSFPRVAVFERLVSGERHNMYVYRDGRYEPERPDAWWADPDAPCIHVSRLDGRLTAASGSWAGLMGRSEAELVGRHFLDFVQPEARRVAQAMFEVLALQREVRSEAVVVRPDGTSLAIEFRAVRTEHDIEVCYRPLGTSPAPAPAPTRTPTPDSRDRGTVEPRTLRSP